jgi:uncharacterized DUF497 family protein
MVRRPYIHMEDMHLIELAVFAAEKVPISIASLCICVRMQSNGRVTPEEVESALFDENTTFDVSHSSGRPIAFGKTITGRFIAIVFEVLNAADPLIIRPISAYDVAEPTG